MNLISSLNEYPAGQPWTVPDLVYYLCYNSISSQPFWLYIGPEFALQHGHGHSTIFDTSLFVCIARCKHSTTDHYLKHVASGFGDSGTVHVIGRLIGPLENPCLALYCSGLHCIMPPSPQLELLTSS